MVFNPDVSKGLNVKFTAPKTKSEQLKELLFGAGQFMEGGAAAQEASTSAEKSQKMFEAARTLAPLYAKTLGVTTEQAYSAIVNKEVDNLTKAQDSQNENAALKELFPLVSTWANKALGQDDYDADSMSSNTSSTPALDPGVVQKEVDSLFTPKTNNALDVGAAGEETLSTQLFSGAKAADPEITQKQQNANALVKLASERPELIPSITKLLLNSQGALTGYAKEGREALKFEAEQNAEPTKQKAAELDNEIKQLQIDRENATDPLKLKELDLAIKNKEKDLSVKNAQIEKYKRIGDGKEKTKKEFTDKDIALAQGQLRAIKVKGVHTFKSLLSPSRQRALTNKLTELNNAGDAEDVEAFMQEVEGEVAEAYSKKEADGKKATAAVETEKKKKSEATNKKIGEAVTFGKSLFGF